MPDEPIINKVLIVGGGTAGWLTAAILAHQLNSKGSDSVKITLVESPDIPILGVGEGTWPNLRSTLQKIGVDETDFIRQCDATFKQGSEFINFNQPINDTVHRYFHPLSAVYHSAYDMNLVPYWLKKSFVEKKQYDETVATQAFTCREGFAPKKITTPAYHAILNYSYHLDAGKFASFLTEHCVSHLGVEHISANVIDVNVDEDGFIRSVMTDQKGMLNADFFVDCSGSRGLLIEGALKVPWIDIKDKIFNDSALAVQVPYDDPMHPIATHTIATAQSAGWVWDIGLRHRRGVGHVYSSDYTNEAEAYKALESYVGNSINKLSVRSLKMKTGVRQTFFKNNCVAIGMSAAFIEPLEASAIFLIDAAATMLADQFPRLKVSLPLVSKKFNSTFALRWDKTLDFIKLHYCISNRRDSEYWIDNCSERTIPDSLKEKLAHWQYHPPSKYDFDYAYEPFVLDSYLFVLYGMQFKTEISSNLSAFQDDVLAEQHFSSVRKMNEQLARELPRQRELIEKVNRYGFQTV
ncbi:tryptophan halogenase family protein [Pleionea litopenaei]|uniref:Tryptophan 7-halogenase n=1 Tax=Pleionea litopenaei TaxID=3070815 RepID=A0AA51RSG0_9GAMM|nr:tryptophan 7-halogenase [Pleionea sp. HL-JVS1]WMS86654.1 tryptophan 7-halogenase [Pleionea sp. HL-JVS1]